METKNHHINIRKKIKKTAFLSLSYMIIFFLFFVIINEFIYKFDLDNHYIYNYLGYFSVTLYFLFFSENTTYLTYAKSDGESIILNHIYGFKSKEEVTNISKSKMHLLNLKKKKKEAELIIKEIENDVDYVCYKTHTFKIIDNQLIIELTKLLNNPENKFMIS